MALPTGASPEVALPVPTVPELTLLTLEVLTRAQGTRQSEGQASPPQEALLSFPLCSSSLTSFLSLRALDHPLGS